MQQGTLEVGGRLKVGGHQGGAAAARYPRGRWRKRSVAHNKIP